MPSSNYTRIPDDTIRSLVLAALVQCVLDGVYPDQPALRLRGARGDSARMMAARSAILAKREVVLPPAMEANRQRQHKPVGRTPKLDAVPVPRATPATAKPAKPVESDPDGCNPFAADIKAHWAAWRRIVPRRAVTTPARDVQDAYQGPQPPPGTIGDLQVG